MKVAIYTCVAGGYDLPREPIMTERIADYYMVSDDRSLVGKTYSWLDIDTIVPDSNMTPKDKNRYCKLHPYEIFPEYDYSIYLDGSIQIIHPITHYVKEVGKTGLAMHRHRAMDCIYSEGIFLTWLGAVDKARLCEDIARYAKAGVPRHFGLFECGMIVTDLNNNKIVRLYENWYQEYMKGAKRDQQALIYTLWIMGLRANDIGNIDEEYNILTNPAISWNRSAHYCSSH